MPSGVLSTILDTTGQRLKERMDESHALDKEMRETQTKALIDSIFAVDENGNPKLSEAQAEEAWARIDQLHKHNKGIKDILGKAREIKDKIFSITGKANPAMAQRAGQQTTSAITGGQGGGMVSAPQPTEGNDPQGGINQPPPMSEQTPIGGSSTQIPQIPYTPPPPVKSQPVQKVASAASQTQPVQPPTRTSPVALMRAGAPNPVKEEIAKENRGQARALEMEDVRAKHARELAELKTLPKTVQYKGKDGKLHVMAYNPRTMESIGEVNSAGDIEPPRSWLSGAAISATDAKKRAANGEKFLDPEGNPIDVSKLGPEEDLRAWAGGDAGAYSVFNQQTRTMTANNQVRTFPALDPTSQTVQGVARVPTVSTNEQILQDVNTGQTVAVPTRSTSTPVTGAGPADAAPSTAAPTAPQNNAAPATPPAPGGARVLPGVLPGGQLNSQRSFAVPLKEFAKQIAGDPKDPNFEPLDKFAYLADDPAAVRRIGTAARMVINDMAAADAAGADISASVGGMGAGVNTGGLWNYIKNTTGFTNAVALKQVEATQKAVDALAAHPDEARLLDRLIALKGSSSGLRSATKGGAYKFAIDNVDRELPFIGLAPVQGSKSFNNKISALMQIVNNAVNDNGIHPDLLPDKDYYLQYQEQVGRQGRGNTGGATPPPARSSAKTRTVNGVTYYETAPNSGKWSTTPPTK